MPKIIIKLSLTLPNTTHSAKLNVQATFPQRKGEYGVESGKQNFL